MESSTAAENDSSALNGACRFQAGLDSAAERRGACAWSSPLQALGVQGSVCLHGTAEQVHTGDLVWLMVMPRISS